MKNIDPKLNTKLTPTQVRRTRSCEPCLPPADKARPSRTDGAARVEDGQQRAVVEGSGQRHTDVHEDGGRSMTDGAAPRLPMRVRHDSRSARRHPTTPIPGCSSVLPALLPAETAFPAPARLLRTPQYPSTLHLRSRPTQVRDKQPSLHQPSATARPASLPSGQKEANQILQRPDSSCPGEATGETHPYVPVSPTPEMISPSEVQEAGRRREKPLSGRGTNRHRRRFPHQRSASMHLGSAGEGRGGAPDGGRRIGA